ncbi:MAG TPA: cation transporter [Syntrophorhabdaceae bacterium]|jgi:copper chaperone
MEETIISIEGMSCQHCVMQVDKALKTLGGIADSEVTIGAAKVHYDETRVKKEDIVAAIEAAGYKVK